MHNPYETTYQCGTSPCLIGTQQDTSAFNSHLDVSMEQIQRTLAILHGPSTTSVADSHGNFASRSASFDRNFKTCQTYMIKSEIDMYICVIKHDMYNVHM